MIIDSNGNQIARERQTITFDDVLLVPQYSEIMSRKSIDIGSHLSEEIRLDVPIISSPMDTITNSSMANSMSRNGAMGILHRYGSIYDQTLEAKYCSGVTFGAAIGVSGDYIQRAMKLVDEGCKVLCVDVAHGHHVLMRHALKTLRNTFGSSVHIMAGNVATLHGFNDLSDWGADSIRVGIGGGSICSTRIQTGHGMPTLQSVMDCSVSDRPAKLIADGGIKTSGDIVKALAAGADFVLLGSLLAGTTETPGDTFHNEGVEYKTYRGMASVEAQIDWRGHTSSVEGVSHVVPYKGPVRSVIKELSRGIRSGFSYSGALNLSELQSKAKFVKQTNAGQLESSTHIKNRF